MKNLFRNILVAACTLSLAGCGSASSERSAISLTSTPQLAQTESVATYEKFQGKIGDYFPNLDNLIIISSKTQNSLPSIPTAYEYLLKKLQKYAKSS